MQLYAARVIVARAARCSVPLALSPRPHAAMSRLLVAALALAALAAARADQYTHPRLIDFNPWSWLPTNRNKSPSIMDYFFPPSRTPKQSILDPPSDRAPPTDIPNTDSTPVPTTIDDRSTIARKVSHKHKPTTVSHATTQKKKVKTTTSKPTPTDTTETKPLPTKLETAPTKMATTVTTARPTKHYTIRVKSTTTTEQATSTEASSNMETDSTQTDSVETVGTTAEASKETTVTANDSPTLSTLPEVKSTDTAATNTLPDTTTDTTDPDSADSREGYIPLRDKPTHHSNVKINEQTKKETVPLPAGSTSVLAKPTKYHYYPHNQHIYLLPECAIQQVCNAVYVRLNYTQPLCACPARYRDPCSASLNADDLHTTRLTTDSKKKYANKAVTLVKTCEAVSEMRECRAPRDWSLLALQNIRTGKSHYLVICRCPENHILEGPMSHDQPTYASVPGIRVYGMMCVRPTSNFGYNNANRFTVAVQSTTSGYKVDYSQPHSYSDKPMYNRFHTYPDVNYYNRRSRVARLRRSTLENPPFPWYKVMELARSLHWIN